MTTGSIRLLTIMGSGETAPTMVKVHREVAARVAAASMDPGIVFLDTPFGFQENAPELCTKTAEFFSTSIVRELTIAGLGRPSSMSVSAREHAFAKVRQAGTVFAGPGSPTYALKEWQNTPLASLLHDKLREHGNGGAITFSSAAALTIGLRTIPVYEIYKAGVDPYWLDGLNLLGAIGINAVLIPHYNNAEGGHHDTRFCYLGERRLALLERDLPDDAYVLGVDEHTALMLDLESDTASVAGLGVVTIRRNGVSEEIRSGESFPLAVLREGRVGAVSSSPAAPSTNAETGSTAGAAAPLASLSEEIDRWTSRFDASLANGDAEGATTAVLELDAAIDAWSTDMLQSDERSRARAAVRSMIVRLGEAAIAGVRDPRDVLGPIVGVVLAVRKEVREAKRYDLSDLIRDGLADCGIEVRDTPQGPDWSLR